MRQQTPWERQQVVYYGKSLEQKGKPKHYRFGSCRHETDILYNRIYTPCC